MGLHSSSSSSNELHILREFVWDPYRLMEGAEKGTACLTCVALTPPTDHPARQLLQLQQSHNAAYQTQAATNTTTPRARAST